MGNVIPRGDPLPESLPHSLLSRACGHRHLLCDLHHITVFFGDTLILIRIFGGSVTDVAKCHNISSWESNARIYISQNCGG